MWIYFDDVEDLFSNLYIYRIKNDLPFFVLKKIFKVIGGFYLLVISCRPVAYKLAYTAI